MLFFLVLQYIYQWLQSILLCDLKRDTRLKDYVYGYTHTRYILLESLSVEEFVYCINLNLQVMNWHNIILDIGWNNPEKKKGHVKCIYKIATGFG